MRLVGKRELSKKLAPADAVALGDKNAPPRDVTPGDVPPIGVEGESMPSMPTRVLPLLAWKVPLPPSLRALGHRNFRLFWTGQLISLIGTWMQMIARGWLVLELTHSAFWLGMVGFANAFPVLLFSLWGGAVADRVPKRLLVICTQVVSMVMALVLAGLTLAGIVEVWHILAVSLVLGTAFAFDAPARQSFTVEMVGKDDLMNAVALNSAIFNGARVVGPAIGAVALAWQGPGLAFLINGLSYIAVLFGLFKMDLPMRNRREDADKPKGNPLEGLRYVRQDRTLAVLMGLVTVVSIFAFPYATLMPIFADAVLKVGEQGYGVLMTLSGVGSLIGALSLMVQSGRASVKRGKIVMLGAIGLPIFLGIFALSSNYLLSLAMLAGVGWTMISINATINTIVQTNVPDELRGRVNGVFALLFIGVAPLGNLQAGLVANYFGAPMAVFLGAVLTGFVVAFVLLRKRDVFDLA